MRVVEPGGESGVSADVLSQALWAHLRRRRTPDAPLWRGCAQDRARASERGRTPNRCRWVHAVEGRFWHMGTGRIRRRCGLVDDGQRFVRFRLDGEIAPAASGKRCYTEREREGEASRQKGRSVGLAHGASFPRRFRFPSIAQSRYRFVNGRTPARGAPYDNRMRYGEGTAWRNRQARRIGSCASGAWPWRRRCWRFLRFCGPLLRAGPSFPRAGRGHAGHPDPV